MTASLRWLLLAAAVVLAPCAAVSLAPCAAFSLVACAAGAQPLPPINAGHSGAALTGKFVWFDLVTDDLDAAARFYADLFDWRVERLGRAPEPYAVVSNGGRRIAGILQRPLARERRAGARWIGLISVPNVIQAVQFAEARGGRTLVAPAQVPQRGAHAILRDPQGAVFGVLRSASGDPPDSGAQPGSFVWAELLTREPETAARFYQGLAGYEVDRERRADVEHLLLSVGTTLRAGITDLPPSVEQPGWLPFVQVDDVLGTIGRAVIAGGKVLLSPRPELLEGRLAVLADPRGGVLGVVDVAQRGSEP
jgi:hypothetical protein